MKVRWWYGPLVLAAVTRLCHVNILWPEETLPLAAAVEMLNGRRLYRDIWFDKPPLAPAVCLLWGAQAGWPLRLAGALFVLLACWCVWGLARALWGEREGRLAALLTAFFLSFWAPAAVMPLASDLLMLAPHAGAVWLAVKGRPLAAGLVAGLAFQSNPKGLLVLAASFLFAPRAASQLAVGFLAPCVAVAAWLATQGALGDYWREVWCLGATYARNTFLPQPWKVGLARTVNWAGFHLALVLGAAALWRRDRGGAGTKLAVWTLLGLAGVTLGLRFFPRYYFLLLPPLVVAAARGILLMSRRARVAVLAVLLIPLIRFGPRYLTLAADVVAGREHQWRDVAIDRDSRAAAGWLRTHAQPGETLFVWGYRPELYVYTRLPAASRFLESQPLTGVFADRHLFQSDISDERLACVSRRELLNARPIWLVDGLTPLNPHLGMDRYPELRPWLASYHLVAATRLARIYRRTDLPRQAAR